MIKLGRKEMITEDIPANFIEGKVELKNAGDYLYYIDSQSPRKDKIAGMVYICPCGCGAMKTLKFRPADGTYVALFTWNGNVKKPTLTPKLICYLRDGWTGTLTKGEFTGVVK